MNEEKILQPEQNYGPGNVLRAKREEYEWSVDAVAEALHLSTSAVKSIEADRYEDLPGATYVIGYWRSYARLLGIDIEDTIEANKRNLNVVTAEASGMDVIRPTHKKKGGRKGMGWLLFLILLGALGYYAWQQNFFGLLEKFQTMQEGSTEQIKPVDEVQPELEPEAKDQVLRPLKTPVKTVDNKVAGANQDLLVSQSEYASGQADVPVSDSVSAATNSSAMTESQNAESQSAASLTASAGQTMGQSGLVLSQSTAPASPATSTAEPVVAAASVSAVTDSTENSNKDRAQAGTLATAESNQSNTTSSQATPAGDSELILTVTKKNWIDVRDKTNKRLEYRAGSAGDVIKVKGIGPFYVSITPPDSVEVRYNGKAFALPEKNNGLSIRFKLDKTLQPL